MSWKQKINFDLLQIFKSHTLTFMSNKKTQVWLPLLFSISMAIGIFIGFKMRDQFSSNSFFSIEKSSPFNEIMGLIKDRYVKSTFKRNPFYKFDQNELRFIVFFGFHLNQ